MSLHALVSVRNVTYGGVYYCSDFTLTGAQPVWTKLTTTGLRNLSLEYFRVDYGDPLNKQYCKITNGGIYYRDGGDWSLIMDVTTAATLASASPTNAELESLWTDPTVPGRVGLGYKYKISTYYKVPNDPYTMKLAIKQYGPIVVGYKWKNSWFTPLPGGILPKPDSEAGGHAALKIGWNDDLVTPEGIGAWECVNSWTKLWGKEGRFYVPYGYEKYMLEAYKAVDTKDASQGRTL